MMKEEGRHGPLQPIAAATGQKLFRLRERDDWESYGPIFQHVMALFGKGIKWSFEFTMKVKYLSLCNVLSLFLASNLFSLHNFSYFLFQSTLWQARAASGTRTLAQIGSRRRW